MHEEISKLFDQTGRVACLTGGASGMGRASGILLAQAGAHIVLGDVNEAGLRESVELIQAGGGKAVGVRCDVSRESDVEALVERTVAEFGRIDIMGNIAGIPQQSKIVDTTEEELDRVLGINLKGVFFGTKAAMKRMTEQGSGNIINISSGIIDAAVETWVCYGMAKAAVAQLTKIAATEGALHGIRVNTIAPGLIVTGFTERHWLDDDGQEDPERREAFMKVAAQMAPMNRTGLPEHIAHMLLYLVSDASEFVTGQILRPNGGTSMPW